MKRASENTDIKEKFAHFSHTVRRYIVLIFLLFLFGVYGFLAWRVYTLSSNDPTPDEIAAPLKTVKVSSVKEDNIKKIEQLKDNSVSVQALFDEARQNPFQ